VSNEDQGDEERDEARAATFAESRLQREVDRLNARIKRASDALHGARTNTLSEGRDGLGAEHYVLSRSLTYAILAIEKTRAILDDVDDRLL
jgi:hypothetical protein